MDPRNYKLPNLQRDLAWIAGGVLAVAAGAGAILALGAERLLRGKR